MLRRELIHFSPVGAPLVGAPPTPRASTRDAPTNDVCKVYQTVAKKLSLMLLLVFHSALYAQDIVFAGTDFSAWNHPGRARPNRLYRNHC